MGKRGPTAPAPTKPMSDKMFKELIKLIKIQCTRDEICGVFGMSDETLNTRLKERGEENFLALFKKHSSQGKSSLRRVQWKAAQEGNPTMLVWLGKQMLGQRDKSDFDMSGSMTVNIGKDDADQA